MSNAVLGAVGTLVVIFASRLRSSSEIPGRRPLGISASRKLRGCLSRREAVSCAWSGKLGGSAEADHRVADLRRHAHLPGDRLAKRFLTRFAADENQSRNRGIRKRRFVIAAAKLEFFDDAAQRWPAGFFNLLRLWRDF